MKIVKYIPSEFNYNFMELYVTVILSIIVILPVLIYLRDPVNRLIYLFIGIFALSLHNLSWITFKIFWFAKPLLIEEDTLDTFLASSPYPLNTIKLSQIKDEIKSGDLIFFVGYNTQSFFVGTKWTTKSPLNHVGVIVKWGNEAFVFEALKEGVLIRPIEVSYSKYNSEVILIRKLKEPLSETQEMKLREFLSIEIGKKHDATSFKGFVEQIRGVVDLSLPNSNKDLFQNEENEQSYFCSELVTAVYIHLGLLPSKGEKNYYPSNEYGVSDFSRFGSYKSFEKSNVDNLHFNSLEDEILILPD